MPSICQHCGIPFKRVNPGHQTFCSKKCRVLDYRQKSYEKSPYQHLNTGMIGAINELLVAADLTLNGLHVFRATSQACPYDLIVEYQNQLLRIQVKQGYKNKTTGNIADPPCKSDYDVLALVFYDRSVIYRPRSGIVWFS